MPYSVSVIKLLEEVDPSLRKVLIALLEEIERQRAESVTKKEFNELKSIVRELSDNVKELSDAQKKSEARLSRLEKVVEELAEAQKRTEVELKKLVREHSKTREQLGELAHTVGYVL